MVLLNGVASGLLLVADDFKSWLVAASLTFLSLGKSFASSEKEIFHKWISLEFPAVARTFVLLVLEESPG